MRTRTIIQLGLLATCSVLAGHGAFAAADAPLLGRGFSPFLSTVEEKVVVPDGKPLKLQGATSEIGFGLIANSEYFERAISADASVAVAGTGWGASANSSLRKRFEENRRQVSFAATIQVVRGTKTLESPIRVDERARALLRKDPARYIRVYGTHVVDSVGLGGAAVMLFTFNFNSVEEAMQFSLSAGGNYGAARGDLKVSISELLKKSSNNVSVSGFVSGTNELPVFFGSSLVKDGSDRATFYSASYSTAMLQQIVEYLDSFSSKIQNAPEAQLSQVDLTVRSVTQIESAGALTKPAEAIFKRAAELGDQLNQDEATINARRHDLLMMKSEFKAYNTEANLKLADVVLARLDVAEKKLRDRRQQLQTMSDLKSPSNFLDETMRFPPTFCTKPPRDISPAPFAKQNTHNQFVEYVVTPVNPNVTYAIRADVTYGHSRTEPGCINGILEVRRRDISAPAMQDAQELISWKPRPDLAPTTGESTVQALPHFAVCRRQPDKTFSTETHSFVASDTRDMRVLYRNWDDIGYNTTTIKVYRCGQ